METLLAFVIGGLYAAGLYLILRRNLARLILGLALLTNAINLLIFTAGRLTRGQPPIVPQGAERPIGPYADPLPQALILTAIVIGFGVLAFAMVLSYRVYQTVGAEDLNELKTTDDLAFYEDRTPEEQIPDPPEETRRQQEALVAGGHGPHG